MHKFLPAAILAAIILVPVFVSAQIIPPSRGGTGATTTPDIGQVLVGKANGIYEPRATSTLGIGGVSSVALSLPTGFSVSGSPITTSGTLTGSWASGYGPFITASGTAWQSFYTTPSSRITAGNHIDWTSNTLDVVTSGDWTGTLDGNEASSLLARANHTGTQLAATISDFVATVRTSISETITGIDYGSGVFSLTSGFSIPKTASTTEWATAFGWGDHASEGYITGNETITLSGDASGSGETAISVVVADNSHNHSSTTLSGIDISADTNLSVSATGLELSGDAIALSSGYRIPTTTLLTNLGAFYASPSTRITAGDALDWSSNTLHVNDVTAAMLASADFGDWSCNGTTCTLDQAYLTGNQTVTLSGDVSGSGATAITTAIGNDKITEAMLKAVNAAGDEEFFTYESTTGDFEWHTCTEMLGAGLCDGSDATGGGGGGSISTSTVPTQGRLAVWTSDATLGDVATGTLSESVSGLELSATRALVGGSAALSLTSGFIIPLSASTTDWQTAFSWGNHASAGYLTTVDISDNTNLTAGDALTITGDDIDFDGGATPGGSLGGTWASPTIDDLFVLNTSDTMSGTFAVTGSTTFSTSTIASLRGVNVIDATTETTIENALDAVSAGFETAIEAAIDTLSNLTSVGTIVTGVWNATPIDISDYTNLTAGDGLTLTGDDIDFDGGATPSGDLGGTWATPSVTDNSHAHDATTISGLGTADISGLDISDDLNLAAGRSLTLSGDSVEADAELYTFTDCKWIENPTAADDLKSLWANKTANDWTLSELWAESDQTVTFMLQVDDGTPADIDSVDLAPAAGEAEDTALNGDTTLAAGEELDLDVASVASTPTWVSICITYTVND